MVKNTFCFYFTKTIYLKSNNKKRIAAGAALVKFTACMM